MNASDVIARLILASDAPAQAGSSAVAVLTAAQGFSSALAEVAMDNKGGGKRDERDPVPASEQGSASLGPIVTPEAPALQFGMSASVSVNVSGASTNAVDEAPIGGLAPERADALLAGTPPRGGAAPLIVDRAALRNLESSSAPADDGAASPVIHIDNIQTFLPVAISQALAQPSHAEPVEYATRSEPVYVANAPAIKTLRVLIEPEALGALTIRLRVSSRHVEVEIDASRPAAAVLLAGTREKLAEAISQQGVSLDVENIKISQTQTPAPMADDQRADRSGAGQGGNSDGKFANDEGRRRKIQRGEGDRRDDGGSFAPRRVGLFL